MLLSEANIRTLTELTQVRRNLTEMRDVQYFFVGLLVGVGIMLFRLTWFYEYFCESVFSAHSIVKSTLETRSIFIIYTWSMF